jgi:hypothetical protein
VLPNLQILRTAQHGLAGQVELARTALEPLRQAVATALYANIGALMTHYAANPLQITAFFDLTKLRETGVEKEEPEPVPPASPVPLPVS